MRSRREFLALAGAVGLGPALAACGDGVLPEPDVGAAGFGEGASGTLRIWTRNATQTGIQVIVDAFEASQDRVRVELTPVVDPQYVTKLATAIRAGSVPDLVDFNDIDAMLFIFRGAFTDVTDLVTALPYYDQLSPGQLDLATDDGRHYGVPFLADNSVLCHNAELLQRAGVDPATGLSSLAACAEAARAVRALGPGTYGWTLPGNNQGIIGFVTQPHAWATDTDMIAGDLGSQSGNIVDNAPLRDLLGFYRTLWTEDLVPRGNFSDAGTVWGEDFVAGTVGLFPANFALAVLNRPEESVARTGITLLPGPTGGASFFTGGDNLCIPRGARNASAAWEFVRFALDLEQQQQLPAGGYLPVRSDAATEEYRARYPLAVAPLEQIDVGFAPRTLSYNLLYNQPNGPYFELFRRAVFDGDLDAALEDAQVAYDRILEQAQR